MEGELENAKGNQEGSSALPFDKGTLALTSPGFGVARRVVVFGMKQNELIGTRTREKAFASGGVRGPRHVVFLSTCAGPHKGFLFTRKTS